ncbi:hypothetical protein PFICI_02519 [Pestalotiopsis fici W106-1]|uniref:Uncharacterized protein n=1 Tax=Pestalotiopsis fici (strain W106-1 / CGMCC3.15140) TaxID=1229662 RepID=W3XEQ2_PESFW|nr:uncharacterized protein PFICI_02519 [Pestalotiopsis fici W106-1]ETS84494.1 hypothetical protein PFICI_02519 [Pestalotiopsis fici W106-1]
MTPSSSQPQDPQIWAIVACPNSGSTLVEHVFAASTVCAVTDQRVLRDGKGSESLAWDDLESFNVLAKAKNAGKRFVICMQELDNGLQNAECSSDASYSPSAHATFRSVYLISDPVRVLDNWKKAGRANAETLVDCFVNMSRALQQAPSHTASSLVYERLVQDPSAEIKRICNHWGSENLTDFNQSLGSGSASFVDTDLPCHDLLSNAEKDTIEKQVGHLYLDFWKDDVQKLRAMFTKKTWFGFDLDDTLHEFRRSSGKATHKVLRQISMQYDIPLPALQGEYSHILKEKTANAFSDGKTSFDYRRERFASLLANFSLPQDNTFLTEILNSYESTLRASLELKCGALNLLSTIKGMGKKIVIMTEGPQDAQERAVKDLGIDGHIDFLATTNYFGVTKVDGLFNKVMKHLCISPEEIVYVGDNEDRDVKPAMAEGILCVHLAETKHVALDALPPRLNTLRKLQYILLDEGS